MHLETVLLVAAVQGYAQAVLLWMSPRGRRLANRLFASLLVAVSTSIALHVAGESSRFGHLDPVLRNVSSLLVLTFGPLLLFYTRALAGIPVRRTRRLGVHFLPVLVGAVLLAALPIAAGPRGTSWAHGLLAGAVAVQVLAYLLWIVRLSSVHSRRLEEVYSSLSGVDLRWLRLLVLLLAAFWVAAAAFELPGGRHGGWHGAWSVVWSLLALTVFVIGYQGLRQPEVFSGALPDPVGVKARAPKYQKSALSPEEAERHARRLEELLATERPHLESGLTLGELARRLGIPLHDLSRVINERLGQSFHALINARRVEEARRMIADPAHAHLTLAAIAERCGFGALSAFNAAFKRHTGRTPSEYRAQANPPRVPAP
jgi:AraC-like DNA-binding protein